ncbi:MAG TPA: crosslink repair DNA glycosylase YcaQ family protein [Solirubrobacteraceae bacterium]|nr:crosslink repair DNA glycosylase YcaQ family protein [Solirubrobacteraceae bacterium]
MDERERPHPEHRHGAAGVHERVPAGRGHLTTRTVSLRHARRLALHAQGLAAALPRGAAGPEAIAAVTERIGCLQLDPVSAVARSPLLVLFARLGRVHEGTVERAAYERRMLFDAWAHEASLVATADLPLHRWAMRTYLAAPTTRAARGRAFLGANAAFCDDLVAELRDRGPLRARELEDRSAEPWRHGWWTDEVSARQTVGRLLHLLWLTGRIGVARREAGERLWDVFERCVPPDAPATTLADDAAEAAAVLRAVRMLGVARPAHVRAHFLRRRYPRLPETLAALTAAGSLERVQVQGLRGDWYAAVADLEGLTELAPGTRTAALSPFDNLLCDRARTAELFGFDHRLEIYLPAAQRRWGYYVLPILHRERLVARADAALDRDAGLLRVRALYHEPDVRRTPALDRAIEGALHRLAAWRGAAGVHVVQRTTAARLR